MMRECTEVMVRLCTGGHMIRIRTEVMVSLFTGGYMIRICTEVMVGLCTGVIKLCKSRGVSRLCTRAVIRLSTEAEMI